MARTMASEEKYKKRKAASTNPTASTSVDPPKKKFKKSDSKPTTAPTAPATELTSTKSKAIASPAASISLLSSSSAPVASKAKPRKRAADFLSDDENDLSHAGVNLPVPNDQAKVKSSSPLKKKTKKSKEDTKLNGSNGNEAPNGQVSDLVVKETVTKKVEETLKKGDKIQKKAKVVELEVKSTGGKDTLSSKTKGIQKSNDTKSKDDLLLSASKGNARDLIQQSSEHIGKKKKGATPVDTAASKLNTLLGTPVRDWPKKGKAAKKAKHEAEAGTNQKPLETSVKTAAEKTGATDIVNMESGDEDGWESDDEDQTGALLKDFESSGDEDVPEGAGYESGDELPTLPDYKKTSKRLKKASKSGEKEGPGTVYVGHIPHGFYENEMRAYFSQFGEITKLRLSRNRQTGASKHYAFIEFASSAVAKIVADTMDNYLMFGHILKCKFAPPESLHPDVWKGANRRFKKTPWNKMERRELERPKSREQWDKKIKAEEKKRADKQEKMKAIGYEYQMPKLKGVEEVPIREKQAVEEVKALEAPENGMEIETTEIIVKDGPNTGAVREQANVKKSRKKHKKKAGEADENVTSNGAESQKVDTEKPISSSYKPAEKALKPKKADKEKKAMKLLEQPESAPEPNKQANKPAERKIEKADKKTMEKKDDKEINGKFAAYAEVAEEAKKSVKEKNAVSSEKADKDKKKGAERKKKKKLKVDNSAEAVVIKEKKAKKPKAAKAAAAA